MSQSPVFPIRVAGGLAFLATAAIGWNLSTTPPSPETGEQFSRKDARQLVRPERNPRAIAADAAAKRMGSIRAAGGAEERMLATLALAESLAPSEFGAWMDGGWFDLRGGPELMMFTKILMDRWAEEDPEGLLAWGLKNKNGAGEALMAEWAAKDPQRLLEWFRRNRDDQKELSLLGTIAGHSPELALQRLREMVEGGISENALRGGRGLMKELAGKSPALLEGMLDSLPFDLKIQAESALSQKRLEASFGDEIRALWEHPDGWKIFSAMDSAEVKDKLMGELGNLPDEWRRLMVSNYYQFIRRDNLRGWLDADLDAAGFSSTESKVLKGHALQNLSSSDPAAAFKQLGETEVEPRMRGEILKQIFRSSLVDLEEMAQQLSEEDREIAASAMQSRRGGDSSVEVDAKTTPQELLDKMVALDPSSVGRRSGFPLLSGWDRQKVDALTEGFSSLPDDQKTRAASYITANAEFSSAPPELRGAALAYLAGMPDTSRRDDKASSRDSYEISFNSITAKVSNYAADMARKDPAKAASWVDSLPAGEAKPWAQYNVHKLWVQYDPDAAGAWKKTLTASEREAMEKVNQRE